MLLVFLLLAGEAVAQRSDPPIHGRRSPLPSLRDMELFGHRRWDIGLNLGTAHALTDIGGTNNPTPIFLLDAQPRGTRPHAGFFARYRLYRNHAINAQLNYGRLYAADTLSPEDSGRYNRRYSFDNEVLEFSIQWEVYLPQRVFGSPLDVYGFLGLAVFYHDPDLRVPDPDNFTPQEFDNIQPAIPMGAGLHYTFPNNLRFGFNLGWRKTFTDHLDGVSTPHSRGMDSYFFNQVSISYLFEPRL